MSYSLPTQTAFPIGVETQLLDKLISIEEFKALDSPKSMNDDKSEK